MCENHDFGFVWKSFLNNTLVAQLRLLALLVDLLGHVYLNLSFYWLMKNSGKSTIICQLYTDSELLVL